MPFIAQAKPAKLVDLTFAILPTGHVEPPLTSRELAPKQKTSPTIMNVQEFSNVVGVGPHTVRYYEKIGLLSDVKRAQNGHRIFSAKDIEWLRFILRLKETGMPLAEILRYAELRAIGPATLANRKSCLEAHAENLKNKIALEQQHLDKLQEKIAHYQREMARAAKSA